MSASLAEKGRQAKLEKQRQEMMEEFEKQKAAITKESNRDRTSAARFTTQGDNMEETLKLSTIGLRHLNDFQEVRKELEEQKAREAAKTLEVKEESKKKKKIKKKTTLSFAMDDDDESSALDSEPPPAKKLKLGKDPTVKTHFLPDREREELERQEREELRQSWLKQQIDTKAEIINVTFSYWDGSGHREDVDVKKGDTIATFLERAKPLFPELRGVNVDNLLYVKEDLIIPHHYTFYDFIINKARGKSGPLFNFDVHDDVRLIADATIEKDESHAGKVVERAWYERNKHIFPANRWEIYDPDKDYGKYRIKDSGRKKE